MTTIPEPHRLILKLCTAEQVGLWFVIPHVEDFYRGDSREAIRSKTLEVLEYLLKEGLIKAGKPTPDGRGFVPWNLSAGATISRIQKEWKELGHEPSIGDIVWFAATPAGNKVLV